MNISLRSIVPHTQLKGIVAKLWVFESSGRMPDLDTKLIVPNGMAKIVIPFRNGLIGQYSDYTLKSKESAITLIGISDAPAIVDVETDKPHGNIGIEFTPIGAYRLFKMRQAELKNKIYLLEDIFGKVARELQEKIANESDIDQKVQIAQSYLVKLLAHSEQDTILEYCLNQIQTSGGLINVSELESKTGYSSRWLYEKFMEKVGLSPKTLSSVLRFMQFYGQWGNSPGKDFFKQDMYQYFYDQAHFSKEFKRFTGLSPSSFAKSENEFGRIFYKD